MLRFPGRRNLGTYNRFGPIQFVWFTASDTSAVVERAFKLILGEEAAQVQRIRPPASPVPITIASSVVDDRQVRVQSAPGRLDFFAEPAPASSFVPDIPAFDSVSDLEPYIQSVLNMGSIFNETTRQAIVLHARRKMSSPDEVGSLFSQIVGHNQIYDGALDLVFQLNKRKTAGTFEINRVLRWQSETAQFGQVDASSGHGNAFKLDDAFYISYILDMNTVPNERKFSSGEQAHVFNELYKAILDALEFETVGDVL